MTVEELITKYKKGKLYSFSGIVTISEVIRDLEGLTIIEHNQKFTEEEAWQLIAKKHGLKSAAQASNVFAQGKVNVWPESYKVKIPKFVAEWIEEAKERGLCIQFVLEPGSDLQSEEVKEWLDWHNHRNQEVCVRAFLDGYEVEEDPKYYVRFPFSVWNDYTAELEEDFVYLHHDITSDETCFSPSKRPFRGFKPFFDKEHIININKDYWPFAVPVEKEVSE